MTERKQKIKPENSWLFWQGDTTKLLQSFVSDYERLYDILLLQKFVSALESLIVTIQIKTIQNINDRSRIPERTFQDDIKGIFKKSYDSVRNKVEKQLEIIELGLEKEACASGIILEKKDAIQPEPGELSDVIHPHKLWQNWQQDLNKIIALAIQENPSFEDFFSKSDLITDLVNLVSLIQLATAEKTIVNIWVPTDNPFNFPHHIARQEINGKLEQISKELKLT